MKDTITFANFKHDYLNVSYREKIQEEINTTICEERALVASDYRLCKHLKVPFNELYNSIKSRDV